MTKNLKLHLLFFVAVFSTAHAADPISKIGWNKSRDLETPNAVEQKTGSQKPLPLLTIDSPGVTKQNHAIGGEIRYTEVAGTGFVEMWTNYENGGSYFSRTLGESGPMAKLSGSSEWRPFLLPFFGAPNTTPTKLQVNLVLPGGGSVEFRNVSLYELSGDRTGVHQAGWWSAKTGNMIGALAGSFVGMLSTIVGILAWLGKGRRYCIALCIGFMIVGGLSLILGIAALIASQPYSVWYPALLIGGVLLFLGGILYPVLRKVYLNHELRTIAAAG